MSVESQGTIHACDRQTDGQTPHDSIYSVVHMRRAVKTDKYDECMPTTHVVCTIGLFSDPYLGGHTWARRPREDCCPMRQLLGYVRLLNHHSTVIKWWRHLVNAHEIKAGMVYLQCKNCVIHT